MDDDAAEEVTEEHVTFTVFQRVDDTEIRHRVISRTENNSDEDFDGNYMKYQVKVRPSSFLKNFFPEDFVNLAGLCWGSP